MNKHIRRHVNIDQDRMTEEQIHNEQGNSPTQKVIAFRVQNFMGFTDTDWVDLKPVTLLFGRNSAGKSALIRALRLLKQSLDHFTDGEFLVFANEKGVDLGRYQDLIFNHDISLPLSFGFKVRLPEEIYRSEELGWIGDFRAENDFAALELVYKYDVANTGIRLESFSLYDGDGDAVHSLILSMQRRESPSQDGAFSEPQKGEYWEIMSDFFVPNVEAEYSLWRRASPVPHEGFLIRLDIPGAVVNPNADPKDFKNLGDDFNFVARILEHFRDSVYSFFRSLIYIGPMREEPKRFYYVPQSVPKSVGHRGQHSVRSFLVRKSQGYEDRINKWLSDSALKCELKIEPVAKGQPIYAVSLVEPNGFKANLQDVGFGLSQLLPIIVESFSPEDRRFIIIEQPELHLHPQAQAELGDLFVLMAKQGMSFLLETHSEHLMLRFRRRIAETTYDHLDPHHKDYPKNKGMAIEMNEFGLLFVWRDDAQSFIRAISVDRFGQLVNPSREFKRFFEDDYKEVAELTKVNAAILRIEGDHEDSS